MNATLLASGLLATGPLAAVDPEDVKPGWLALVIVLLMGAATYLLWRSMNHQLGKVTFDEGTGDGAGGDGRSGGSGGSGDVDGDRSAGEMEA